MSNETTISKAMEKSTQRIEQKITGWNVAKGEATDAIESHEPLCDVMNEDYARPEVLQGASYKIKTPLSEHALYITINDTVLNPGTEHEERRPFEIFINSKNMDHFQWVLALTRVISGVWRKGGDCVFLVEELQAVFDPKGGYFKPGGQFMPSLVAEIGDVIGRHLRLIGQMDEPALDEHQTALIAQKRAEYEAATDVAGDGKYPAHATLCNKCHTKAVVRMDNCNCCLQCGDSKCG